MRILVCGASGFIGSALTHGLRAAGHEVVRGVRHPREPGDMAIDYAHDTDPATWKPRLAGIDAVVNAVGIIVERPGIRFLDAHERAPIALFHACAQAGVRRVVQISALGADTGDTTYFRTKLAADLALMSQPLEWQVLRPSLVYGENGASASSFRTLASLPLIAIPSLPRTARFQPVHIDDVVDAVVLALDPRTPAGQCIDCVGATRHPLREMLSTYRSAFRFGPALWLPIPRPVMALTARITGLVPGLPLNPETWRMLQQGSAADAGGFCRFLGRAPKGLAQFISGNDAERLRARASSGWQFPLLRVSLAAVWILTALVSAFVYARTDSLDLLARVGLTGSLATLALYGTIALDLALGLATLLYPRRVTWITQVVVILGYTTVIALALPEWLAHPFGPILKNLPILAILTILIAEEPPWKASR